MKFLNHFILLFVLAALSPAVSFAIVPKANCQQAIGVSYDLQDCYIKSSLGTIVRFYKRILDPKKATLILLPGLNRNMVPDDVAFDEITKTKLNVVFLFASVHLESIEIAKNLDPRYPLPQSLRRYSVVDFAQESAEAIESINAYDPIIVSLSATSSWTSEILKLMNTSKSIDSAPFVSFLKDSLTVKNSHLMAMSLYQNPFTMLYAEALHFNSLKNFYATSPNVSGRKMPNGVSASDFAESLASISFANRDFDWEVVNFSEGSPGQKVFILAGKETKERLKAQVNGLKKYLQTNPTKFIYVKPAEHAIMGSHPKLYAAALEQAIVPNKTDLEVIVLDEDNNGSLIMERLLDQKALQFIDNL